MAVLLYCKNILYGCFGEPRLLLLTSLEALHQEEAPLWCLSHRQQHGASSPRPAQLHGSRQIRRMLLVTGVLLISTQPPQAVHQGHSAATDHCHQAEQADPNMALRLPISMSNQQSFVQGYKQSQSFRTRKNIGADICIMVLPTIKAAVAVACWKSAVLYSIALLQTSLSSGRWQQFEQLQ